MSLQLLMWNTFLVVVIGFCVVMIYLAIRSQWVHRQRIKMLDSEPYTFEKMREFNEMPTYDQMIGRFFVWDFEKLKRGEK